MKKIAIIILALIVGLCLAHGAFAAEKKYMVILVDIESGEVEGVFEATLSKGIKDKWPIDVKKIDVKEAEKIKPPFKIKGFTSDKAIGTFYARYSPGCRYIRHPAGYYMKVCN